MSDFFSSACVYVRAVSLAAATGGRTVLPAAVLSSRLASAGVHPDRNVILRLFGNPNVAKLLVASAAGELCLDKLPQVPSRLEMPYVLGRMLWGGIVASITLNAAGKPWLPGAAVGAFAGLAGANLGYHLRRKAGSLSGLPDPIVALGEDAVVIGSSILATRSGK